MNLTGPRNLTLCNCNLYGVRFKYIFAFLVVHFQKLFFFFHELHIFVKKFMSQTCKFCCRKKDKCQQKNSLKNQTDAARIAGGSPNTKLPKNCVGGQHDQK